MDAVQWLFRFVKLSRPHFLLGGALMYGVGAVAAGISDWRSYWLGQLAVSSAQLTAHYLNEYFDIDADRLTVRRTLFSGGSGVLATGQIAPHVALRAGLATSAITLVGAAAVSRTSMPAALILGGALAVSWAYSAPPVRLLATGWGEIATTAVVAGAVPAVGSLMQGRPPSRRLWWEMAALGCVHLAMMLVFEVPDLDTDEAAGKTGLAVRLGLRRTVRVIGLALGLGVVLTPIAVGAGDFPRVALWVPAASIVPASATMVLLGTDSNRMTATAVLTFVAMGLGFLVIGLG